MPFHTRARLLRITKLLASVSGVFLSPFALAQIAPGDVGSAANSTFDSPVFKQTLQRLQNQSAAVMRSIDSTTLARVRASLPNGADLGRLRYGSHNVVSRDGESVVGLIIQAAHASAAERTSILTRLNELSANQVPEALAFEGFAAEYGLWGIPKDQRRALAFYQSAAAQNYQPAVYDLALAHAYGKGGPRSVPSALALLSQASNIAPDPSGRVCGFGAFLSYRTGDRAQAMNYSHSCLSDLADIPKAVYGDQITPTQQVTLLRSSIATGIDDGYSLVERAAYQIPGDPQYLGCKYALVNRYRGNLVADRLKADALACYRQHTPIAGDARAQLMREQTVVPGIVSFVPLEIRDLEKLRASNHFHYAWSVPYLPFRQDDATLFEPFVLHQKS